MATLFEPWEYKGLQLKNRIMMSPMCQYSVATEDGVPGDWHFVHYVSRAVGGTGLIMMEMTDVEPDGRITVRDLGLWEDRQIPGFLRIVEAVHALGAKIGVQLAHAGRKAQSPSLRPVAPSPLPFEVGGRVPHELTTDECARLVEAFGQAARRAVRAGMDTIELHGAHGYLLHQFMSPYSNRRRDRYGDPLRFPLEVVQAVRAALPSAMPLIFRVSAQEYLPPGEGYDFAWLKAAVERLHRAGVDLFDVSSGGNSPAPPPRVYPGYQVGWAAELKRELGVPVIAVGMLDDPLLAEAVVARREADLVAIGRGMLRHPYWANQAALALQAGVQVPAQYFRAFDRAYVAQAAKE